MAAAFGEGGTCMNPAVTGPPLTSRAITGCARALFTASPDLSLEILGGHPADRVQLMARGYCTAPPRACGTRSHLTWIDARPEREAEEIKLTAAVVAVELAREPGVSAGGIRPLTSRSVRSELTGDLPLVIGLPVRHGRVAGDLRLICRLVHHPVAL
ncbi:MAG: hypothetical protein ACRDPF_33360 [Streptosporangiaceae bacterium]